MTRSPSRPADTLGAVNSQLAKFAVTHRPVIPTGATDRACWLVDYLTGVGAPKPVAVAVADGRRSLGATYHVVPRTGDQSWQVLLRQALTSPDDDLAATLDAIDPLHEALVLAPPILDTSPRLLDRRAYGWRRSEWARYEDKIVSNAIWPALDVHRIPATVCPPTVAGVTDAWQSFGRGPVVVSSDASHGYHSGGNGVRNTVTLTLAARLLGRDRNTLSYHAHRTMPLLAFAAPDIAATLAQPRRTRPPRTIEALQNAITDYESNIKSGSN